MDHIRNRPMDERSIVAKENVNSLPNDQTILFLVVSLFQQLPWHLLLPRRRYVNPEFNVGGRIDDWLGSAFLKVKLVMRFDGWCLRPRRSCCRLPLMVVTLKLNFWQNGHWYQG